MDRIIEKGYFGTPNNMFDPAKGYELYHEYLDEKVLCEDLGFDGVALNEHHDTPFTMGGVMDVEASILARITKKVKIILIGNPLPLGNPLRLAEELAMIDVISGGRLVPGWVRGAGSEQFALNSNPAYNREYFNEAHDFIVKAWTQPGPWRYEGKHFHYRFVDPWPVPMQKPHPQMWIPGLLSPETALWCAEKRYPYIALATFLEPTLELWNIYRDRAAEQGYQVGPENFGYMQKVYVADTDEKAYEIAKFDMFGGAAPATACSPSRRSIFLRGTIQSSPPGAWRSSSRDPNKKRSSSPFQGGPAQSPLTAGQRPRGLQRPGRSAFADLAGSGGRCRDHAQGDLRFLSRGDEDLRHHLRHPEDRHPQAARGDGNAAARRFHPVAERRTDHAQGPREQPQAAVHRGDARDARIRQGVQPDLRRSRSSPGRARWRRTASPNRWARRSRGMRGARRIRKPANPVRSQWGLRQQSGAPIAMRASADQGPAGKAVPLGRSWFRTTGFPASRVSFLYILWMCRAEPGTVRSGSSSTPTSCIRPLSGAFRVGAQ